MYNQLKRVAKSIIPKEWLRKHEDTVRAMVSVFYKGNNFQCPICQFKMSHFVRLKNGNTLCPHCGSLSRTRRLWTMLEDYVDGKSVLHFSPSKSISYKFSELKTVIYETSDFMGEFQAQKRYNIEAINVPNDTYDVVICYHILEHINKDAQAMAELYRILRPNGICYIQTPFKSGDIYEDDSITTSEERLKHFGQEDHVRIYSVQGLMGRLVKSGFKVKAKTFSEDENNFHGFSTSETVIIAEKGL
ncbi:methyltransferase domain-containing protein [uncultured Formosa sp.]|uniref:methyltransferase domain-containing protein n=1 Tax=uncultured Formosa sp. TaxID=255435 RepID=UPI0026192835|nr:methyltransferase domain-containing protein [uncultured Formosa sp.]